MSIEIFKMPSEAPPVPSIINRSSSSDEESFVVLGKSLADFDESAISLDRFSEVNSLGANIIQEAQQLISQELAQMEKQVNISKANESGQIAQNSPEIKFEVNSSNTVDQKKTDLPKDIISGVGASVDANKHFSMVSVSSEIVSEELQQKISHLIEENKRLEDTIRQNNICMKSQYDRIVAWQEDVQKVHEAHKEKFLQAKQYVEALKKENYSLKQEIEKLTDSLVSQKSEHAEQNQLLVDTSVINIKEFELEAANMKLKQELEAANQKLKEITNSAHYEEKLTKYEKELEEAYKKIRGLEVEVQKRRSLAEIDLEQSINQMKGLELSKDKETLETEMKLKSSEQSIAQFEMKAIYYKNQISTLEGVIGAKNAQLLEAQSKLDIAEQKLEECTSVKQQLEIHIKSLQGELEEKKIEIWKNKTKETEKEKFYQEQVQTLKAGLNSCSNYQQASAPSFEVENLRQQLMQSQIALTNCEQKRVAAYSQLEECVKQVEELTRHLQEASSQSDDVFALKTQIDVYKADFEAEREAKEEMRVEKDKISEDLQHLHRRNQQLQEEIELLRQDHPASARNIPERAENAWSAQSQTEQLFKCPKCGFGFHSLNACENHVMRCIELDDNLP